MNYKTVLLSFALGLFVNLFFFEFIVAQELSPDIHNIKIKLEFGHNAVQRTLQSVSFGSASPNLSVSTPVGNTIESDDSVGIESHLQCGAGDVDGLIIDVGWSKPSEPLRNVPRTYMWKFLFENGLPGQVARLSEDPWKQPDAPILTVQLNKDGTRGFSLGLEQLLAHGAMWLPEHDIFITIADKPLTFEQHLAALDGQRTLDRIKEEPDASLEQFKSLWTDFGNPLVKDPSWEKWQTKWMETLGHLTVTTSAHGSIYKYAVDRWGNVRPDFASPHKFKLDMTWQDCQWEGQKIMNGLPVIITNLEKNGQFCEIEQFVSPLGKIDASIQGYIPGVMLTKVNVSGKQGAINFTIIISNEDNNSETKLEKIDNNNWILAEKQSGNILLMLETESGLTVEADVIGTSDERQQQVSLTISGELKKAKSREFIIKLPSPVVPPSQLSQLEGLDYSSTKNSVINYWNNWLSQGAQFNVPEEKVNHLFRANLWHALVLPRHTIGKDNKPHMDIPYANTAYGQQDADWPINQAVYVDYMIYGLRGYETVAEDEISAMFKTQQQPDGRIGGFANWGVYSPGHLYAIAQNYLLSHNKEKFERLLPNSMELLDWCLLQLAKANIGSNKSGLIVAPLNDLTISEREWAFTQAYFYGGLELFSKALSVYGHPRADEVNEVAAKMKKDIEKAFALASVTSPVVQLADGTWNNYVPSDAMTPRRLIDQWYPTDVDTGPLHLPRLGAIGASSWLTTAMLHDHEDNLFLYNQGAANEPVYLPQANVYLLRDEPGAVIRSFYSMMACAFSHNQLTSIEHRWGHPIYYSPPSTDGAWFEIYRKMLLNELGYDTLFIGQAIPRNWLKNGKIVEVKNAPSYFGPVSFTIHGENHNDEITANLELSDRNSPKELLVRLRHPESKVIRSVVVNGKPWTNYDVKKEYIRIPNPTEGKFVITAKY